MKLEALLLLAFYFFFLAGWGIQNHNKYKNSRLQLSAISKGIRFQRKYRMLKSLYPKEEA